MKILITGAAGRIGAHLTRACLDAGHEVRAFVVPGDPRAELIRLTDVELVEGDLCDREMLQRITTRVDAIAHLAGALTSRGNTDREFIDLNLNATFDLLVAARAGSPNLQRFAYASSDAVYNTGGPAESLPIDETTPVRPGSVYGASKTGAEQLCLSFWRSEGFPATILRFGATCDAGELIDPDSVFARWLYLHAARDFLASLPARSPAQEQTLGILESFDTGPDKLIALTDLTMHPEVRQWGDARDVAAGCLRALTEPAAIGEIFDLGGAAPFTTVELARHISSRTGMPSILAPVPTARPPWYLSSAKAERLLGYGPPRTVFAMVDEAIAQRS
ncbi:MAG TPA: NAD(P)-dependent oxidoreductase [Thermomicrobiales bacterium]|nr:NAD(P)-dependent oxidoreductase [Thermomicrobiales bacterium]